jgi:hypothetical protein
MYLGVSCILGTVLGAIPWVKISIGKMKEEKWITVYKFYDVLTGQRLEKILKENNIPVSIISRQDSAYDGIFKSSIGEGILQVREDYVKKAEQIIAEFEKEHK